MFSFFLRFSSSSERKSISVSAKAPHKVPSVITKAVRCCAHPDEDRNQIQFCDHLPTWWHWVSTRHTEERLGQQDKCTLLKSDLLKNTVRPPCSACKLTGKNGYCQVFLVSSNISGSRRNTPGSGAQNNRLNQVIVDLKTSFVHIDSSSKPIRPQVSIRISL